MKLFVEEYGKNIVSVFVCVMMLGIIFSVFCSKWSRIGGAPDSIKTNFQNDVAKRTPPIIKARDIKASKKQKINFGDYIEGYDYDGKDISQDLELALDNKDACYVAWNDEDRTKWEEKAGIYHLILRLKSRVTGRVTTKKIILLVDNY